MERIVKVSCTLLLVMSSECSRAEWPCAISSVDDCKDQVTPRRGRLSQRELTTLKTGQWFSENLGYGNGSLQAPVQPFGTSFSFQRRRRAAWSMAPVALVMVSSQEALPLSGERGSSLDSRPPNKGCHQLTKVSPGTSSRAASTTERSSRLVRSHISGS